MTDTLTGLELRSTVTSEGELRLELVEITLAAPEQDEVVVRMEAAPINPSDLGLLLGPADLSTLKASSGSARPSLTATVPTKDLAAVKARLDQSMAVGNEGAGTVISAGREAAHLVGCKVSIFGGGMYTQYRKVRAGDCIPLPDGATAADGAAMFVNPLTALSFVETMRAEGHTAIVHSAAASNLGQMLNKICIADAVPLVNIVRSEEQVDLLRAIGAKYVLDSNSVDFNARLIDAIAETGATIAFDPIGGGALASQALNAMEAAASRRTDTYSRYGSDSMKQVYIYGGLDTGPTIIHRTFGYSWNVGGWLLMPFLNKLGAGTAKSLRQRVLDELKTTFASHYSATISLAQALKPEILQAYQRKATGTKYLINPSLPM